MPKAHLDMLLVEEQSLLRKTVAMTARSLDMGVIHEASSMQSAERMLGERAFCGAVISLDSGGSQSLALLDRVRDGRSASMPTIPIAVMVDQATVELMVKLRALEVSRVILKPFRAKILLEAFESFRATPQR